MLIFGGSKRGRINSVYSKRGAFMLKRPKSAFSNRDAVASMLIFE